ncbi:MAG: Ldh family oxidoreductase [Proteobacteria bacterium]|nr:Ldh family oxidoreductase [Pseudomonadota bacterium]
MADGVVVSHSAVRDMASKIFEALDVPPPDARQVADGLVWADLRGIDSHGIIRIPSYVMRLDKGVVNPKPNMQIVKDLPAAMVIDADQAHGQIALSFGMNKAMEKARHAGVGWVIVGSSTHSGAVGMYTRMAAEAGMIGIHMGTSNPNMAYHGTRVGGVATSPMAISVPRGDGRILSLDMATAIAGVGKLMHYKATNQPLGEGWALDADGNPTTDPQKADLPTPLGGPKGSGLSFMFECITSLMVGPSLIGRWLTGEARLHKQNVVLVAVDIGAFIDLDAYKAEADYLVAAIKDLPKADGVDEIFMPGERGDAIFEQRLRDGIPVPQATWDEVGAVAERFGVPLPEVI